MGTGGLLLKSLMAEERQSRGVPAEGMALRVEHVGEYGDHAVAKRAGFQKNDVIIAVDGRTNFVTESQLLAYAVQQKKPGDKLQLTVLRGGKETRLEFALQ
jgi:S1-C subfamily serine protease